jgi:hypothetical protein
MPNTYDAYTTGAPILGDMSKRQAVILWDHIRGLGELLDHVLSCAGDMNKSTLHGFTSRIEALRDDLADGLPRDPRILRLVRGPSGAGSRRGADGSCKPGENLWEP